jgi:O-antigen ligase
VILAYVAIGWNSNSRIFAPIQLYRSVGDGQVNSSTLYRDLENFNLLDTLRENAIVGTGFGHEFNTPVTMPDISFFKEWRYMPHNSMLGLWCFTGWLGFTSIWLALAVGVLFAARSYHWARMPDERTAAFTALAVILIYSVQCWGDIGFSERTSIFLVGPALAVAGQLAVSTGAWGLLPNTARIPRPSR